ncbi:hypothetical protein CB0940_06468 [Cercospora beticola]|uniref:BTB domain-containing protein n=1 Tax=Cercospora beticola TaxID=122368 RepID=A0A2G5HXH4_CERBT|nr:hypothetical protein CB0940_06468 [Cercospora beticola]PIA97220.1 hypothetical protein CB0940_06468 [Cercospora beticola]WPA99106.1 hypothetical protein RHO25_003721 [Cercospora beticola]CAK1360416.1 unnamed protein product [Cercospora beticola]
MTLTPNSMAPLVDAPQELAPARDKMANEQQVSKKRRYASAIIAVVAGQDERSATFHVHEDLLREHSHFFDAALNHQWKEAQERKITLPEDNPDVVDVYVQWLYGDTVKDALTKTLGGPRRFRSAVWAVAYLFGDKIQDRPFSNAVMEAWTLSIDEPLDDGLRRYVSAGCVRKVYKHTTSGSLVRQFLVHIWAHYRILRWMKEGVDEDHLLDCPEFLLDLARATVTKTDESHQSLFEMREKWLYDV